MPMKRLKKIVLDPYIECHKNGIAYCSIKANYDITLKIIKNLIKIKLTYQFFIQQLSNTKKKQFL